MNKVNLLVVLVSVTLCGCTPPATEGDVESPAGAASFESDKSKDEQAIRSAVARMPQVWNTGDMAGYFDLYAENEQTTLVFSDRITVGWQSIRNMFENLWPTQEAMGVFEARDVKVRFLSDDLAVATGIYQHQFPQEYVVGAFSLVFERHEADWKIVHEHTSRGPAR
ncbi:MAG: YybH family protein [Steroidobacteraceae bacterium]